MKNNFEDRRVGVSGTVNMHLCTLEVNIPKHTMYVSFHLFMNKGVSHSESLPVCSW